MTVHVPKSQFTRFEVRPLTPNIGAELLGLDLSQELDDAMIGDIRAALLAHKVVFFRDQNITRAQHLAFARRFGPLEIHPATPRDQPDPEVLRIAHGPNSRGVENNWHSDVTWRAEPSLGSILRAIDLPEVGGDTLFSDMYAAYEALSPAMKAFVCTLEAEHDIARVFAKRLNQDIEKLHEKFPVQVHPVVRTHPETGKRALYVNTGFTTRILGLSKKESDWLLDHLYSFAAVPEHVCRFRWAPGSLAFWDNRACQHYAASDYFPAVRIMERVTIAGDRPFFDPSRG
ncbi:alpha-ketoglutarate-dependent taurine dioxygenase [Candidatus Phycosocius bacilliformis]|uniref:Alpha-ketoglutarate-dependent taurine dioxygenase n=1 Tax=Candidatus Phycosocius bacilliformis TaxID=1445552 RepID=A0A2P2ECJ7_9PROT|nr:TauD/TfdA family dioxygenase [Candidatus Phycosocius bacilliformis]GBF58780.1 alpha-ketoglutarate-dependent taurine dioxygenase [Candidatus Phycosocius bacilliformis]